MYCILLDDWNPRNYPVGWISPHFLTPLTANIWFWAVSHAVLTSKDELCQRLSPYRFLPRNSCPFHFTACRYLHLNRLGTACEDLPQAGNLEGGSCFSVFAGWKVTVQGLTMAVRQGVLYSPSMCDSSALEEVPQAWIGIILCWFLLYLQGISTYYNDD